MTFLQDLIAFSLQTLRLNVTYDQVPVLARHGLVSIAIDGFDELGDPNGYDLAWGQVNDLIGRREMPRYVRRSILGADFLSAFDDLASHLADSDPARVRRCFDAGVELAKSYLWTDRGARNLGVC